MHGVGRGGNEVEFLVEALLTALRLSSGTVSEVEP